jgi:hypothetical protein
MGEARDEHVRISTARGHRPIVDEEDERFAVPPAGGSGVPKLPPSPAPIDAAKRRFIVEVMRERKAQDQQWGGPRHNDEHTYVEFLGFIRRQLGSVLVLPGSREELDSAMRKGTNLADFRSRMVKVAALAMAAVESTERKSGKKY